MPTLFVSDAVHQERLVFDPPPPPHGQGRRRWKALSALYQASFAACGYRIEPVVRPEIYQTEVARQARGVAAGDWHLAVKPLEHLRPFHGIPNVFVCDWPFPELSAAPRGGSPFFDQRRLLDVADAVLCCTAFTASTLRNAGVTRVITLPPYIPPPGHADAAPPHSPALCRFLCVLDNDHLVRGLGPVIEGFARAATQHHGLRLRLCLQGGDEQALAALRQRVAEVVTAPALAETISVVDSVVDPGGARADFFLCADAAPGLPLPLVDAMLAGLPLVTTMAGGIGSVLPPEAAVTIVTQHQAFAGDDEPIGRFLALTCNAPTADTVQDAILVAASLNETARTRMAAAGREIAERHFGLAAFRQGLQRLGAFLPALLDLEAG
jgi:glycosyltransferase involved in cell wall biosynthesis